MTSDRLRQLAAQATPGPWVSSVDGAIVFVYTDDDGQQIIHWHEGSEQPSVENARLIAALGPDAAVLLADAIEWIETNAPETHHPTCLCTDDEAKWSCDCGFDDAERLLASFASLGEHT